MFVFVIILVNGRGYWKFVVGVVKSFVSILSIFISIADSYSWVVNFNSVLFSFNSVFFCLLFHSIIGKFSEIAFDKSTDYEV